MKEKSRACFSQPVIGTDFRTPDRIKCLVCHIKRIWQKEKRVLPELSINNEKIFYKNNIYKFSLDNLRKIKLGKKRKVVIVGAGISIGSSCSDENDYSLAGRPMMYCTLYTIDEITDLRVNDTLDSLTITAPGTDSIILNNQKKVHTLMLPLRYTSDTTVFILRYDPDRKPNDVDTLIIVQQNTPYFQSMECGYMMKQNILSARYGNPRKTADQEKIDSLHILNKEANTNEIQNLEIFYRYRDRTPPTIE